MLSLVASGDELVQLTDKIFKRRERQLNSQQYLLTVYVLTKFWPKIQNRRNKFCLPIWIATTWISQAHKRSCFLISMGFPIDGHLIFDETQNILESTVFRKPRANVLPGLFNVLHMSVRYVHKQNKSEVSIHIFSGKSSHQFTEKIWKEKWLKTGTLKNLTRLKMNFIFFFDPRYQGSKRRIDRRSYYAM